MPRPHFTLGKHPVPILQEAGRTPGPVWTGGKSSPHRDSIPDRPARSSVAIPNELPGPHHNEYWEQLNMQTLVAELAQWLRYGLHFWQRRDIIVPSKIHCPSLWPNQHLNGQEIFFLGGGQNDRGVKLSTHFLLVPRLRMSGTIPLLPLCVFLVWRVTTKPIIFLTFFYGLPSELKNPQNYIQTKFFFFSLLPNSTTYRHQQGPTNICSHTTTVLTTHRCILMDCFNNCNFSKHKLMRSLMMV